MDVKVISEHGYNEALYGFSLSFKDRAISPDDWWSEERRERTERAAVANCGRGLGHDKWIRQVMVWVDIEAPRYWWSEFDTYKIGTVAQSESTMHTLSRRDMTKDDCADVGKCSVYLSSNINRFNIIKQMDNVDIQELKAFVPEAYLQRRLVTMNYEVLRTIIKQRSNHRLPEWSTFIDAVKDQVEHPELLP